MKKTPVFVLNPRRRRKARKMSALQRMYFGGGRKRRVRRNEPAVANARRSYGRRVMRLSRRARRNPPEKLVPQIIALVRDALTGTVGVAANNMVGNVLSERFLKVSGAQRSAVKVGTAVLIPAVVAMLMPRYKRVTAYAGSVALAVEATKALERTVYPQIGNVGKMLSTSDGGGSSATVTPVKGLGYNSDLMYPPGGTYAERITPVGAYIDPAGRLAEEERVVYDPAGGVY